MDNIVENALAALAGNSLEEAIKSQCLRWEDFPNSRPVANIILYDLPLDKKKKINSFVDQIEQFIPKLGDQSMNVSIFDCESIINDKKFTVIVRISGICKQSWDRACTTLVPLIQHSLYE